MTSSVEWTTKIKDVAEVIAVFVGGAWAYFNHFRGRTYKPRIELSLEAEFLKDSSRSFLKISSHAKNVGLSRVAIDHQGTAIRVYVIQLTGSPPPFVAEGEWALMATKWVFQDHPSIESREPVQEPLLLELPQNPALFYKTQLILVSRSKQWTIETLVQTS